MAFAAGGVAAGIVGVVVGCFCGFLRRGVACMYDRFVLGVFAAVETLAAWALGDVAGVFVEVEKAAEGTSPEELFFQYPIDAGGAEFADEIQEYSPNNDDRSVNEQRGCQANLYHGVSPAARIKSTPDCSAADDGVAAVSAV